MADSNAQVRDRLLSRPIIPVTVQAERQIFGKVCLLVGWSLRESAGAAGGAAAELYVGSGVGGQLVGEAFAAQNASSSQVVSNEGVLCEAGLFYHQVSGAMVGVAWVRI